MGFIDTTAKIIGTTARVLDEIAFWNMRRGPFYGGRLYDFRMRPIGLHEKSYGFMLDHLSRNIGNSDYVYDGYSTPIGELCNPFYNTEVRVPWFFTDNYKNSTANYLDYVRMTYGATLSVKNINTNDLFHISEDASSVGYVDGKYTLESLANGKILVPNMNETYTDTHMGLESGYYVMETLKNARVANDSRRPYGNSITEGTEDYVGITTNNIVNNKKYLSEVSPSTGRFEDGLFSPIDIIDGPIENSNYGHYSDLGSYTDFYDSLSKKFKEYYEKNVYADGKIYYPTIRKNGETLTRGKTYLGRIGVSVGHDGIGKNNSDLFDSVAIDELQIRYVFSTLEEHSNISDATNGGVYVYAERENNHTTDITYASFNSGTKFSRYTSYGSGLSAKDLLYKTNESFKNGSYKTIIARFHTDAKEAESTDITQTAISKNFGLSHGRNLLKTKDRWDDESEGYNNPYCRVWTFHHQYHTLNDAIRPLQYTADELYGQYNFSAFTADHSLKGFENGRARLERFGSLNKNNGLVNITPIDNGDASKKVDIKNCMFSIENLAWKDAFSTDAKSRETFQTGGLSPEQKGPFGGRIMWFPPYDLKFSENVSVNWNENHFIGRGEGIYTYTNTTRSGNLSFKILVDHPSIINYWENRGKSVSNSVDDVDDPEQQILRFFAGCDMLMGKPGPEPETEPVIEDEPIPSSDTQILKFFVFYPNNYSGIDDDIDFAMAYLVNGLGAGKANNSKDDYRIPFAKESTGYGGYEVRPKKPISTDEAVSSQNDKKLFIKEATVGNTKVNLYAQIGDETDVWWKRKWYYRVDNEYKNQILKKNSYIDMASYGLNSSFGQSKVIDTFNIQDADNLYSLTDVYVALEGGNARTVLNGFYNEEKSNDFLNKINKYGVEYVECIGRASVQGYSKKNEKLQYNRATTVQMWLSSKPYFNINNIETSTGGTGGEGSGINNGDESSISNKLWRCTEVNIHLKNSVSKTIQAAESEKYIAAKSGGAYHQINTPQKTIDGYVNMGVGDIRNFNDLSANKLVEEVTLKDKISSIRLNQSSDNLNGLALNLNGGVRNTNANNIFNTHVDFTEYTKNLLGLSTSDERGKSSYNFIPNEMHDNAAQSEDAGLYNSVEEKADYATIDVANNGVTRYDNESKFFSMLEKEEPFLHHKISDKVKYFDPAFHSISPEGFNARLTFLQQCTRQGPTVGNSDIHTENSTANNLAFGRPPVCILRIGDFYYTKILIESMTINFDPLMWDLNTEGIGVMPMIANVDLNFKFIGGSSLAGHIARLQNALSFNYYANTEVYDDRSELAQYDENGNIERLGTQNLTN